MVWSACRPISKGVKPARLEVEASSSASGAVCLHCCDMVGDEGHMASPTAIFSQQHVAWKGAPLQPVLT